MTAHARIPNRNRNGWITIEYRPGTLDENILDEIWLGDSYHLEGIADVISGGVVIDVGANIGAVTLKCLDLGARKVLAIEPENANHGYLTDNTAQSEGRVDLCHWAVGDPGKGRYAETVGTSGDAYTMPANAGVDVADFASVMRRAVDVDDTPDARVALLKVDVEGAEYDWFGTATPDLLARIDRIHGEFHGLNNPGVKYGDYGELMTVLAQTHSVSAFGSAEAGGHWYAHRS